MRKTRILGQGLEVSAIGLGCMEWIMLMGLLLIVKR